MRFSYKGAKRKRVRKRLFSLHMLRCAHHSSPSCSFPGGCGHHSAHFRTPTLSEESRYLATIFRTRVGMEYIMGQTRSPQGYCVERTSIYGEKRKNEKDYGPVHPG